jgi:hypothetical protein
MVQLFDGVSTRQGPIPGSVGHIEFTRNETRGRGENRAPHPDGHRMQNLPHKTWRK